MKPKNLGT